MREFLTRDEIEERYAGEWVLLDQPVPPDSNGIAGGYLLWRTPDHDEIWRKALELTSPPRDIAVFRAGPIPDDVVYIL